MNETDSGVPPANIYEANGQLSVAVPVPGAQPDHARVTLTPDRLRLEALCKYEQESQHYLRRDWQVGLWRLDLPLPRRVDPAGAHATLNLGVLVVMAPLSESGQGDRRVQVEAGHPAHRQLST